MNDAAICSGICATCARSTKAKTCSTMRACAQADWAAVSSFDTFFSRRAGAGRLATDGPGYDFHSQPPIRTHSTFRTNGVLPAVGAGRTYLEVL